mmetsp:Transcript_5120/g.8950  ORF Transcript_5120/g.8950 Transcript_5120/m.8950 type:complete len:227 (-) Transcript_5120:15-695(-)
MSALLSTNFAFHTGLLRTHPHILVQSDAQASSQIRLHKHALLDFEIPTKHESTPILLKNQQSTESHPALQPLRVSMYSPFPPYTQHVLQMERQPSLAQSSNLYKHLLHSFGEMILLQGAAMDLHRLHSLPDIASQLQDKSCQSLWVHNGTRFFFSFFSHLVVATDLCCCVYRLHQEILSFHSLSVGIPCVFELSYISVYIRCDIQTQLGTMDQISGSIHGFRKSHH